MFCKINSKRYGMGTVGGWGCPRAACLLVCVTVCTRTCYLWVWEWEVQESSVRHAAIAMTAAGKGQAAKGPNPTYILPLSSPTLQFALIFTLSLIFPSFSCGDWPYSYVLPCSVPLLTLQFYHLGSFFVFVNMSTMVSVRNFLSGSHSKLKFAFSPKILDLDLLNVIMVLHQIQSVSEFLFSSLFLLSCILCYLFFIFSTC